MTRLTWPSNVQILMASATARARPLCVPYAQLSEFKRDNAGARVRATWCKIRRRWVLPPLTRTEPCLAKWVPVTEADAPPTPDAVTPPCGRCSVCVHGPCSAPLKRPAGMHARVAKRTKL